VPDIKADPGAADANSFVTLEEFDLWLDTRLNASSLVTSRSDEDRARALIDATREISAVPDYVGTRATTTQAHSWPRMWAPNPDKPNLTQVQDLMLLYFDTAEIPKRIKEATFEWAMELLKGGSTDLTSADPKANVTKKVVGPLETDYANPEDRVYGIMAFPRIFMWIQPLLDLRRTGGLNI